MNQVSGIFRDVRSADLKIDSKGKIMLPIPLSFLLSYCMLLKYISEDENHKNVEGGKFLSRMSYLKSVMLFSFSNEEFMGSFVNSDGTVPSQLEVLGDIFPTHDEIRILGDSFLFICLCWLLDSNSNCILGDINLQMSSPWDSSPFADSYNPSTVSRYQTMQIKTITRPDIQVRVDFMTFLLSVFSYYNARSILNIIQREIIYRVMNILIVKEFIHEKMEARKKTLLSSKSKEKFLPQLERSKKKGRGNFVHVKVDDVVVEQTSENSAESIMFVKERDRLQEINLYLTMLEFNKKD
jgi:hypothetical protein